MKHVIVLTGSVVLFVLVILDTVWSYTVVKLGEYLADKLDEWDRQ